MNGREDHLAQFRQPLVSIPPYRTTLSWRLDLAARMIIVCGPTTRAHTPLPAPNHFINLEAIIFIHRRSVITTSLYILLLCSESLWMVTYQREIKTSFPTLIVQECICAKEIRHATSIREKNKIKINCRLCPLGGSYFHWPPFKLRERKTSNFLCFKKKKRTNMETIVI